METPGFKPLHRGFLTLAHAVTYCCFAAAELAREGWTYADRKAPLATYAVIALFCFLSVFLANNSLTYIDYSTRAARGVLSLRRFLGDAPRRIASVS